MKDLLGLCVKPFKRDPYNYGEAFIFYSKDLRAEMEKERKLRLAAEERIAILAFMYSLYESCKMNDIDFGEYVEDILTRMMNGDDDPGKKQEKRSLDTIKWRKI